MYDEAIDFCEYPQYEISDSKTLNVLGWVSVDRQSGCVWPCGHPDMAVRTLSLARIADLFFGWPYPVSASMVSDGC